MSAVDVAYTIEGAGPPLYMVHGIGSRRVTWSKLVAELKADFTCVRTYARVILTAGERSCWIKNSERSPRLI